MASKFCNLYLDSEDGLLSGFSVNSMSESDAFAYDRTGRETRFAVVEYRFQSDSFHVYFKGNQPNSDKDPTEGLEFVVWVPGSKLPITTRFKTRKQAQACAHRMAEKEGVEAFVCAMVDQVLPPPKAKSERKALLKSPSGT